MSGGADAEDRRLLLLAIELSKRCVPSASAFSVGAVIVDERGAELARGFSRELPDLPRCHAEEAALHKLLAPAAGATLYSSLEPCSRRASGKPPCTERIIAAGIGRVVIAWREPPVFVPDPSGVEVLTAAGIAVVQLPELAAAAAAVNAHLLERGRS